MPGRSGFRAPYPSGRGRAARRRAGGAGSAQQVGPHAGNEQGGRGHVCMHTTPPPSCGRAYPPRARRRGRGTRRRAGTHPQRGGSGLTGRPPRRGEGPTPSPLHAPHRASVAPTAHLQRALPSDRPPDADGCRVARCSPGGEPPARYRTVAQLSNSHTRRRARRSSVSTRSRAIGSGSTLGVGGWGVPGGRSRGPRWSRPPPVTSARRQPWWWTATIPARPHPARRARPPDHPRPGPTRSLHHRTLFLRPLIAGGVLARPSS